MQVDAAPLDELGAELLQVHIPRGSKLHGVYLSELRLPSGAMVSRGGAGKGTGFTPEPTHPAARRTSSWWSPPRGAGGATERRIRAVDRAGRYARWQRRDR